MRLPFIYVILFTCFISQVFANSNEKISPEKMHFKNHIMEAAPYLPANSDDIFISCPIPVNKRQNKQDYRTAAQVNYQESGWEERIAADWDFFDIPAEQGRILAIDFSKKIVNGQEVLSYKYLANSQTQHQLYEPWSSSKVMAITATMAQLNKQGLSSTSKIGDSYLADLITSIHSYQDFGSSKAQSNDIATFMLNIVGRRYVTSLFHDNWLKLSNPQVRLQGAYGTSPFKPTNLSWSEIASNKAITLPHYENSTDDPYYQGYRCDTCSLTGNKPMSTLAEAEWLKRLASHEREPQTQHPYLTNNSIEELFYATSHTDTQQPVGGMMQGVSRMMADAVAKNLSGYNNKSITNEDQSQQTLNQATNGQWRIFQKIGWGYSETRGAGETVMLAHVCLPDYQGGKEFTIAAQVAVPGSDENLVIDAGMKMQKLLDKAVASIIAL